MFIIHLRNFSTVFLPQKWGIRCQNGSKIKSAQELLKREMK